VFVTNAEREVREDEVYYREAATYVPDEGTCSSEIKRGKRTNGDKADYPIGFHGGVSLVVRLCLGWERLLWRRQAFDDVLRTTGYLETVPGASSESWA
jgi:hypothetical protein